MFGDLTTLTLGYRRGWDRIFEDRKDPQTQQIVNDTVFYNGRPATADHRGYSLSLSQILTRNPILDFNYELLTDQGYLANPYRKIRFLSPGEGEGFTLADQVYPDTRTSNAGSVQLKYYLPYRAAITGQYRFFRDTWGIVAHTVEVDYTHPWKHWIFDGSLRYYRQTAADFYSDLFPRANYQNFMARDRELAAFHSYTIGAGGSYQFAIPGVPCIGEEHDQPARRSPDDRLHRLPQRAAGRHLWRRQRAALQAQREHLPAVRLGVVLSARLNRR